MSIIRDVSDKLKEDEHNFRETICSAKKRIKHLKIPKKTGTGYRKIFIPPWEHKIVQYWAILNFLRPMDSSESATAFRPGSSTRNNAAMHKEGRYFVHMDISEFFPSITAEGFLREIAENHPKIVGEFSDPEVITALFHEERCAIGYPASPYIANIAMKSIDKSINDELSRHKQKFGNFNYTRYADDITVSIENRGFKHEVEKIIKSRIEKNTNLNLYINEAKTKFGTRKGENSIITGLRILSDKRLTLHRKYKDHIRLLLSLYKKGILDPIETESLRGHLNYCSFADPFFYNNLVQKNFDTIERLNSLESEFHDKNP